MIDLGKILHKEAIYVLQRLSKRIICKIEVQNSSFKGKYIVKVYDVITGKTHIVRKSERINNEFEHIVTDFKYLI